MNSPDRSRSRRLSLIPPIEAGDGSWTIAAVCVMGIGMQLLTVGLGIIPEIGLAQLYGVVYLLVGICMFMPARGTHGLGQLTAFVTPGILLGGLWAWTGTFWCGLWLLALPAWGLVCLGWKKSTVRQRTIMLMIFLPLMALTWVVYVLGAIIPNPAAFLLPLVPLKLLADPGYRSRRLRSSVEVFLSFAVLAFALFWSDTDEVWAPSWTYAGGAILGGLLLTGWVARDNRIVSAGTA